MAIVVEYNDGLYHAAGATLNRTFDVPAPSTQMLTSTFGWYNNPAGITVSSVEWLPDGVNAEALTRRQQVISDRYTCEVHSLDAPAVEDTDPARVWRREFSVNPTRASQWAAAISGAQLVTSAETDIAVGTNDRTSAVVPVGDRLIAIYQAYNITSTPVGPNMTPGSTQLSTTDASGVSNSTVWDVRIWDGTGSTIRAEWDTSVSGGRQYTTFIYLKATAPAADIDLVASVSAQDASQVVETDFDPGAGNTIVSATVNRTAGGTNPVASHVYRHDGTTANALTLLGDIPHADPLWRQEAAFLRGYPDPVAGSDIVNILGTAATEAIRAHASFSGVTEDLVAADMVVYDLTNETALSAQFRIPVGNAMYALAWGADVGSSFVWTGPTAKAQVHDVTTGNIRLNGQLVTGDATLQTASWTQADADYKGGIVLIQLRQAAQVAPTAATLANVNQKTDTEIRWNVGEVGVDAASHQLQWSTAGAGGPWTNVGPVLGPTPTQAEHTGATPGVENWYRLQATNAQGTTDGVVNSRIMAPARPTAVSITNITATSMDYEPVGGAVGTANTTVEYRGPVGGWTPIQTFPPSTTWPQKLEGLQPNSTYTWRANCSDINGTSGYSPETQANTLPVEATITEQIDLLSDLPEAGGVLLATLKKDVVAGTITTTVDNRDEIKMSLTSLRGGEPAEWLQHLRFERVIRWRLGMGVPICFRVSNVDLREGSAEGILDLEGEPIIYDLTKRVQLRSETVGDCTRYNLGALDATPDVFLDTLIIPAAQEQGVSYFSKGTVEFTDRFDIAVDGACYELLNRLVVATGGELDPRYMPGVGYSLDIVRERGAGAPVLLCKVGRNMEQLNLVARRGEFCTVLIPRGRTPTSQSEAYGIGEATWPVGSVQFNTPATNQHTVTFATPPNGGDGPVLLANQYVGNQMLLPDLTYGEILAVTPQSNGVDSTAVIAYTGNPPLAAGDVVEIHKDTQGTWLTELVNKDQVDYYGPLRRVVTYPEERGERNWVRNPLMDNWTSGDLPDNWTLVSGSWGSRRYVRNNPLGTGEADGAQSGVTSLAVRGYPANHLIQAGDWIPYESGGTQYGNVTEPVTLNASGAGTVTLDTAVTVADGQALGQITPTLTTTGGTNAIWVPRLQSNFVETPAVNVKFFSGRPLLYFETGVTCVMHADQTISVPSTDYAQPAINVYRAGVPAGGGATADPFDLSGRFDERHMVAAGYVDMGTEAVDWSQVTLRINGLSGGSPVTPAYNVSSYIRWAALWLQPLPAGTQIPTVTNISPVDGSHGTRLAQRGNRSLVARSASPRQFRVSLEDLTKDPRYVVEDETPTLGGKVRVVSELYNEDTVLRIWGIEYPLPFRRDRVFLTLSGPNPAITRTDARPQAVFVKVDVSDLDNSGEVTEITSPTPPTDSVGSYRTIGTGFASGQLPIVRLDKEAAKS